MKKILHIKIAGFSLIEALIAVLVVGVGMLGLAKMQGELFVGSSESRMRAQALNLAQDKIEEFRKIANKDLYDSFVTGSNTETLTAGSSANFTRAWTVTDNGNYKQISVTVTWTDSKGVNKNVQLTSNVAATEPVKTGIVLASLSTTSTAPTPTTTTELPTTTTELPTTTTQLPATTTQLPTTTTLPSTTTTTVRVGGACTGLVTAAIITGPFESAQALTLGAQFEIHTNPLAVCTVLTLNSPLSLLGIGSGKNGTYICSIQDLDPAIVKLSVGGKEIDLSVNLALSDIPLPGVVSLLDSLLKPLNLPPDLVCVKANVALPIKLTGNPRDLNVTIQEL